ncbi:hypothetical protein [Streptomyces anandii]|uniref:hypothetical protein n=1 Tax=Streptomyces anandii TaxID=285454 RepID=UPI00378F7A8D
MSEQIRVTVMSSGEVRLSAGLLPEEMRHGCYLRGMDARGTRALAIELLQAADEAEQNASAGPVRSDEGRDA